MNDITKICKDCGQSFIISVKEQRYFNSLNYEMPKRCRACRNKRAQERRKIEQNKEEHILAEELKTTKFNIVDGPIIDADTLVIIGNGFDLAHGIPSSYYSFRDKCNGQVKAAIELFIDCDDVWGDFENNLAYLDREKVIWSMWDFKSLNGVLDEEDDDFSAADFFTSIEDGGWGISSIINDLPKAFRKWINSLDVLK